MIVSQEIEMLGNKEVNFSVTLSHRQAWGFAQFLKRVEFDTYLWYVEVGRTKDERKETAYELVDAGEKIREALAEVGYAPR